MRHRMVYLIVAIPACAVLMGAITLYLAFSRADPGIPLERPPLSKTSWQEVG